MEKNMQKYIFNTLRVEMLKSMAAYPAGVIGDTKSNLEAAAAGWNMEWTTLYANFAKLPGRGVPRSGYIFWTNIQGRKIPREQIPETHRQYCR